MRRRLTIGLTVGAMTGTLVVELWRSGMTAPLAFGARAWVRARPDRFHEPDPVA